MSNGTTEMVCHEARRGRQRAGNVSMNAVFSFGVNSRGGGVSLMKSVAESRTARFAVYPAVAVLVVAIATIAVLFTPAPAGAVPHANDPNNTYWNTVEPSGSGCYGCHSLDPAEGEPGTSYIMESSRTLPGLKTANGGVVPANLGCTYCHNRSTASAKMKGVLPDFAGLPAAPIRSQHPVGRTFTDGVKGPAYTDTEGYYLSTYASNTANEMDCLDCHEAALIAPSGRYMAHADPPRATPTC